MYYYTRSPTENTNWPTIGHPMPLFWWISPRWTTEDRPHSSETGVPSSLLVFPHRNNSFSHTLLPIHLLILISAVFKLHPPTTSLSIHFHTINLLEYICTWLALSPSSWISESSNSSRRSRMPQIHCVKCVQYKATSALSKYDFKLHQVDSERKESL